MIHIKFHLLIITLLCSLLGFTQPNSELEKYRAKYPNHNVIHLVNKDEAYLSIVKNQVQVYEDMYDEHMVLNDQGAKQNQRSVEYSYFTKIERLKAKTFIPSGNKYKELTIKEFSTKDEVESDIFYQDVKSINFTYPGLESGAKYTLEYRQKIKEPRFFGQFFFANSIAIEHSEFSVTFDKNIDIEYKLFHVDTTKLSFTKTDLKDKMKYTWIMKNNPQIKLESSAPNPRYYLPHIVVYVKSYTVNKELKPMLRDVSDLHTWYKDFIKDINKDDLSALKKLADSLTTGYPTTFEKVKNLYYWVQDNIKYVAFEDGLGGFIPRNATAVCDKRFGDCKDMANIISTMAKLANIPVHLTWIGTNDIPYTYDQTPTPAADNHMIACYEENGKAYFLDATNKYNPIDLPSSFIQGKEALVHKEDGSFEIKKVPVVDASLNHFDDQIQIKIDGNKIIGKGKSSNTGYFKVMLANRYLGKEYKEKLEFLNDYLEKGSNKFLIEKFDEKDLTNRHEPSIINYSFNIANYIQKTENEIFVNMCLDKLLADDEIEKDRKYPIERNFKTTFSYRIELEIPEGYKANFIPTNSSFEHALFGYNSNYTMGEKKIILDVSLFQNFLILEKQHFDDFNKMIKKLRKFYAESITLQKI